MDTEKTMELLKRFKLNGISHDNGGIKHVCDYQDCIGHATPKELQEFESKLDVETRRVFFWVNAHCLSMDSFLDILKKTYLRRQLNEIYEQEIENVTESVNKKYAAVRDEWTLVRNERDKIAIEQERIAAERKRHQGEVHLLERRLEDANRVIAQLNQKINDYEDEHHAVIDKANRFDAVYEAMHN